MGKTATRAMPDGGPPYRLGVGLIIVNDKNETLACQRLQTNAETLSNNKYPASKEEWQWPQGGLDEGEDALATAYREMEEEVGLKPEHVTFIGKLPCETTYHFPDWVFERREAEARPMKYRGQIHQWFVFRLMAPENMIKFDTYHEVEFSAYKWLPAHVMPDKIVDFKRQVYAEAAACLKDLLG
jgi:putative (di)nucleoside polyphosphate hydrolase